MTSPSLPHATPRQGLPMAVALGFVVLYFLLDWVSFVHPMRGTHITAWNPHAALVVALLARFPTAWWLVVGTLAAAALARTLPGFGLAEVAASAVTALGYVATARALAHWLGPTPPGATRRAFASFVVIIAVGAALIAVLYVGALGASGFPWAERLPLALSRRWLGDFVSLLVTLPALMVLADATRRAETVAMLRSVEWWLVAGTAMVTAYMVFARPADEQFKFFYLLFLPVAWGAARFAHAGAVWSAVLVQTLLILAVQSAPYQPLTVFELHMLMAALGAMGLLLGATVEERQQSEEALRASLHAAAAADMAAALAHELNQPLTALRTYARAVQMLAERQDASASSTQLQEVAGKVVDEVTRAGAVVQRLRDFFKQHSTDLQPTEVAPLIGDVLRAQEMHAQAAGVALRGQCDPDLAAVWMDRVQIQVVLRNLIANAIDAARAQTALDPVVAVNASTRGGQLVVEVQDNGAGLAVEELSHAFESRSSSKPGGMGIGLAISRAIVEAHEGRMWAEPGPGGRFFFSLPTQQADHA
jgi:two-component system sensor kinase FixL